MIVVFAIGALAGACGGSTVRSNSGAPSATAVSEDAVIEHCITVLEGGGTPEDCEGSTTSEPTATAAARCEALANTPGIDGRLAGDTGVDAATARAALKRANQEIPAGWQAIPDRERLLVCNFDLTDTSVSPSTIRCANGAVVDVPPDIKTAAISHILDTDGTRVALLTAQLFDDVPLDPDMSGLCDLLNP